MSRSTPASRNLERESPESSGKDSPNRTRPPYAPSVFTRFVGFVNRRITWWKVIAVGTMSPVFFFGGGLIATPFVMRTLGGLAPSPLMSLGFLLGFLFMVFGILVVIPLPLAIYLDSRQLCSMNAAWEPNVRRFAFLSLLTMGFAPALILLSGVYLYRRYRRVGLRHPRVVKTAIVDTDDLGERTG